MKYLVKFIFGCLFCLSILACGNQNAETKEQSAEVLEAEIRKIDYSSPEYSSVYICPMHCKGSGSGDVGKCQGCGMDYVANTELSEEKHAEEGHDHDHDNHDDHN